MTHVETELSTRVAQEDSFRDGEGEHGEKTWGRVYMAGDMSQGKGEGLGDREGRGQGRVGKGKGEEQGRGAGDEGKGRGAWERGMG